MRSIFIQILFFLSSFGLQAKPVRVMLLTGQTDKYHNWKVTSSHLKAILDNNSTFKTDVVLLPAKGAELDQKLEEFLNCAWQPIHKNEATQPREELGWAFLARDVKQHRRICQWLR